MKMVVHLSNDYTRKLLKKVVVIGDQKVGKTCLVGKLTGRDITANLHKHIPTMDECYTIDVPTEQDGRMERVQFIDTGRWMEFPAMHSLYVNNCSIAMIVYDASEKDWSDTVHKYINSVQSINPDTAIVVVGTRCDTMNVMMDITPLHVQNQIPGLSHSYVSSTTNFGIRNLLRMITSDSEIRSRRNSAEHNEKEKTLPRHKFQVRRRFHSLIWKIVKRGKTNQTNH